MFERGSNRARVEAWLKRVIEWVGGDKKKYINLPIWPKQREAF